MERLYQGKEEMPSQTIYRLPDISPLRNDMSLVSYKQLGDTLLNSARTQYIV